WLPRPALARHILFPAFTVGIGTQAFCLCGKRTCCPRSATGYKPVGRTDCKSVFPITTIGPGKSYPVTAAQLLPNLTGIPRTAPQPQLTKNKRPQAGSPCSDCRQK